MILLFKPEFVEPILRGVKTETRRRWKQPLVKPGLTYWAATGLRREDRFAVLKIVYVRKQRLGDMTEDDARKEGCRSLEEFKRVWRRVYGHWDPSEEVYVIGFKVLR